MQRKPTLLDWLGLRRAPNFARARWLGPLVTVLLALLALTLLGLTLGEFIKALAGLDSFGSEEAQSTAIRNTGLVLAALIGVPFLVWRSVVAQRQVDTAAAALFNERMKAAADDLHARREIRREADLGKPGHSFIEDDIVRRTAGIDALEALARERPAEAPRIGRLLCTYLRELSKLITPESEEHPRADMEAAAQTVGRLQLIEGVVPEDVEIDLRGANLAGFDLSWLSFRDARFDRAKFEHAYLRKTDFSGCQLYLTDFSHADCRKAKFVGSRFFAVKLDNSRFSGIKLRGAAIRETDITFEFFDEVRAQQVFLDSTVLDGHKFSEVTFLMSQEQGVPREVVRSKFISDYSLEAFASWRDAYKAWRDWQKSIGFDPENPDA